VREIPERLFPHRLVVSMEENKSTFKELGLIPPLLYALRDKGYGVPTPIQEKIIPALLTSNDMIGSSQTGTGKTAAFTLPILQKLSQGKKAKRKRIRALILCPTRELALQIDQNLQNYGKHLTLSTTAVFGGVKINSQKSLLGRGIDILTATPGRLLDLFRQKVFVFDSLEFLVLDEADRLLAMGFTEEVNEILSLIPGKPQSMLFSATLSQEIRTLAAGFLKEPLEITISETGDNETSKPAIEQWVYPVDRAVKPALLTHIVKERFTQSDKRTLVFVKTKNGADRLVLRLEKAGISSRAIHGDKSQGARNRALREFKSGEVTTLIATDLAARGLDINGLPMVINYDLPHLKEDYIHRIGRTGRAGAPGLALSLVCAEEFPQLADIERLTKQVIPRKIEKEYPPKEELPPSKLDLRPFKPKKPKKKKIKSGENNESL
jgi:ATP-dependent RNA helicase RhlE